MRIKNVNNLWEDITEHAIFLWLILCWLFLLFVSLIGSILYLFTFGNIDIREYIDKLCDKFDRKYNGHGEIVK